MPRVTVHRAHNSLPQSILSKVGSALENTAKEFEATDMQLNEQGNTSTFSFRTMGFTISGQVQASPSEVVVDVDLPAAATPFQSIAEQVISRNVDEAIKS